MPVRGVEGVGTAETWRAGPGQSHRGPHRLQPGTGASHGHRPGCHRRRSCRHGDDASPSTSDAYPGPPAVLPSGAGRRHRGDAGTAMGPSGGRCSRSWPDRSPDCSSTSPRRCPGAPDCPRVRRCQWRSAVALGVDGDARVVAGLCRVGRAPDRRPRRVHGPAGVRRRAGRPRTADRLRHRLDRRCRPPLVGRVHRGRLGTAARPPDVGLRHRGWPSARRPPPWSGRWDWPDPTTCAGLRDPRASPPGPPRHVRVCPGGRRCRRHWLAATWCGAGRSWTPAMPAWPRSSRPPRRSRRAGGRRPSPTGRPRRTAHRRRIGDASWSWPNPAPSIRRASARPPGGWCRWTARWPGDTSRDADAGGGAQLAVRWRWKKPATPCRTWPRDRRRRPDRARPRAGRADPHAVDHAGQLHAPAHLALAADEHLGRPVRSVGRQRRQPLLDVLAEGEGAVLRPLDEFEGDEFVEQRDHLVEPPFGIVVRLLGPHGPLCARLADRPHSCHIHHPTLLPLRPSPWLSVTAVDPSIAHSDGWT